jgi:hypothetical protein
MGGAQINYCRKCGVEILPIIGRGIVVYQFGQTLGIKPRRKTSALGIPLCSTCGVGLSIKAPAPEEGDFFNYSAYQIMRNLTGADRPETQEAFRRIFDLFVEHEGELCEAQILNALPEPEILMPERTLKAAS